MITAHTDVVGSLLRPVALRKARDDWMAGRLSHAQFKSIEDRAVDEAVCLQEAAGLDITACWPTWRRALGLLQTEIERDMKLMGCTAFSQLSRDNLRFR
jgi:methionine synthase II (cobalamin-independent)